MIADNLDNHPQFNRDFAASTGRIPKAIIAAPLDTDGSVFGVLEVLDPVLGPRSTTSGLELVSELARQCAAALALAGPLPGPAGRNAAAAERLTTLVADLASTDDPNAARTLASLEEIASALTSRRGDPMHLLEIGAIRNKPAAGLYLALTRRCPLSCAHCSTDSSSTSEQHPETPFRRLVESFEQETRPDLLLMSGGEALLRAALVADLARTARSVGTRSYVLSGMWFARENRRLPAPVSAAIREVDHFAASLDEFHEREVGRADVFRAMHRIRELVPHVSFQLTGRGTTIPTSRT